MVHADVEGLRAATTRTVRPEDCATQWGNDGLEVLSTPAILGHTERLCAEAMAPYLEPGEMSVGVQVEMHHRAPAPVGGKVDYRITAPAVDRRTEFGFEVRDEADNVICNGTHLRAVVAVDRFLERYGLPRPAPADGAAAPAPAPGER
ncbi:thioesterase family protein [Marinitenerispora sediminis]|uniref:Thioesterase n=1 Tax=Marinitenerispora sediminis TaxID=1931232 RepID=A0A368SZ18_9ACTN|nr:thioesterase [Marinitenerispora sediminis]RCV48915.1 thioesterase [Marinitenerispora sediminis]RCV49939.1 thioesterase [Marinitenerispora sediminis]RCV51928.1 thioesterase [Marinitenerispora sediminis]